MYCKVSGKQQILHYGIMEFEKLGDIVCVTVETIQELGTCTMMGLEYYDLGTNGCFLRWFLRLNQWAIIDYHMNSKGLWHWSNKLEFSDDGLICMSNARATEP